jgi:hypothetical protein
MDKKRNRRQSKEIRLGYEPLEPRIALAAAGLIPVGAAPAGELTGKIVYTSGGHGWQWNSGLNRYATDRPEYGPEIVEDFGNQDQMTYYAEYLLRAGATVVPMRPVGHQTNEVVLDNDSPGVTFTGAWSNSVSSRYYDEDYGAAADAVPYRSASISATETATATYTPNIPEAGFYPVYTWVLNSPNRTNQLYKITDSSGTAKEIRVDHRMVGGGWIYLGTYHFDSGSSGNVQISNQSTAGGSAVIADAIRFGNGMGDSTASGGPAPSGYRREDENSLHWIFRSLGIGTTLATAASTGNVSAPSNFAEWMNSDTNPFGSSVYISFHSNGSTGDPATATARGVLGLIDSDQGTPNQASLALYTGRQINNDMGALNGTFEHNWFNRTTHTLSGGFGEIDLGAGAEMDATIVEVGFHDNTQDSQLLRDPRVRDQMGRSTYEATLEYFDNFGGLNAPVATPSEPTNLHVSSTASGQIALNWAAGSVGVQGAAATGYRVYASSNGYAFDAGTLIAGGGTTSATLSGYDPTLPYYFKVVAVNAGGESRGSEIVTVTPDGGLRNVLIVSGFDRQGRTQNVRYPYAYTGDGLVDRPWERSSNSYDYVVQYASAINAVAPEVTFDTASNEAVINGSVNLNAYNTVIWILGEESTSTDTFNATEQSQVSSFLAAGGNLFVSGSEIGWDLDAQAGGATFFNDVLRADYVADDANTYSATAAAGSIFAGLPTITFDNGAGFNTYNVDTPDRINPTNGSAAALTYSTGGAAAIQYVDGGTDSKVVMFAFPFETIKDTTLRNQVFARVLDFFDFDLEFTDVDLILDNDDGPSVYTETGSWTTSGSLGFEGGTYRFATVGAASTATWEFYAPFAGQGEVFVQYLAGSNRATSTVYHIDTGNGIQNASIDQEQNSFTWVSLGMFDFTAGGHTITIDAAASSGGSVVVADVARVLIPVPVTEPSADFDGDGDIDGRDFLIWQRGFGATNATPSQGDANADGNVDATDLTVWQDQYAAAPPVQELLVLDAVDAALSDDAEPRTFIAPPIGRSQIDSPRSSAPQRRRAAETLSSAADGVVRVRDWLFTLRGIGRDSGDIATTREASPELTEHGLELDAVFASLGDIR